ncbi:signal peptidase II [Aerococcaceae bacterium DSM 111022]|nr:signal peptidase II [Aerococcaceae bacterium DSM 111022]
MLVTILTGIFLLFCDQFLKIYIHNQFQPNETKAIIDNVLNFTYIRNDGAGWGILSGQRTFFIVITLIIIVILIRIIIKNKEKSWTQLIWLGMILSGAIGNLIDRIILGYVVDMFHLTFIDFPVFNIADMALTVGIVGLMIVTIITPEEEHVI